MAIVIASPCGSIWKGASLRMITRESSPSPLFLSLLSNVTDLWAPFIGISRRISPAITHSLTRASRPRRRLALDVAYRCDGKGGGRLFNWAQLPYVIEEKTVHGRRAMAYTYTNITRIHMRAACILLPE